MDTQTQIVREPIFSRQEQGVEVFNYLEPKYALKVRGSRVIDDPDHVKGIDGIVSAGGR